MAKKPAGDHTPEEPTLDDNTRWLQIEVALERLIERTPSDTVIAIIDLQKALADGRQPCMVRSTKTGERKFVVRTAWRGQIMLDLGRDGVRVVHHYEPKPGGYVVHPFSGGRFFVWQPAFDRIWPPPASSAPEKEPVLPINRAKAVLRYLYLTKADMPGSLKAITNAVEKGCKELGWQPVSSQDTVHRAAEELGYRPPRKRK